ncbi:precorrin-3B C(17)-methyltransferase [Conexibacter sp. SYSU D00693]|uniref:precorrin-3B C(17)-methyltransferase n=1 Tax=Conexibacter sp. SYSU D00693 TaxID=2812560 RepID=UPI00196B0B22|nr:precorrin-3B C(17)-methyltransferase [Conexibacter sp. SYSU D00693]
MSGRLDIVGLGPGGPATRTSQAAEAVARAEVVVGYGAYVDQCADLLRDGQEVVRGRMGEEEARADEALERARGGARVALVSSGDAGVYGMAARTLARAAELDVEVHVVPGMTAAQAAAALLGAPLADDFAVLSLSDIRTPWETVERRLAAVAVSGLALCLYNPRSKARTWQLDRVLELLRDARGGSAPVAVVTDAAREGEAVVRTTLADLDPEAVTMRSLLIVGGETAQDAGPWLVADRDGRKVPGTFHPEVSA